MRHGIVICAFVLAAGLLLSGDLNAGNLEPPGPPAPTMKTIQQVEPRVAINTIPVVIAAPGSYYLTSDLIGTSGQVGIIISSSFVTLDLNGFSLIGVPGSLHGIRVQFAGTKHIVIRNGAIRGWGQIGVSADLATEVHAEDLRVDANVGSGLVTGNRSIVRDTTSTGNGGHGIEVGRGGTIIGCTAATNTANGLVTGLNSVVSNSTASNTLTGISMNSGSTAIDCTAQQNDAGFSVTTGGRVVHSVARANVFGILGTGGEGVSIEDCTVDGNTDDGIVVGSRSLVRGNVARGNTNDGIQATGNENRIEDNESTTNGTGIRVDGTNNLVVKNSVSANNFEYLFLGPNNKIGPISADPTTAGPWANFDL